MIICWQIWQIKQQNKIYGKIWINEKLCVREWRVPMLLREELELDLNNLRNKRDDLEEQMLQVKRIQEEEEYNILCRQRKMEQLRDDYGQYAPELESVLEEENAYIENFKIKYEEYREQIKNEYDKEIESIDREVDELQAKINLSTDEKKDAKGEEQHDL